MTILGHHPDIVEVLPDAEGWVVRVTESGQTDEMQFHLESAARSYAEGQRLRLKLPLHADKPTA